MRVVELTARTWPALEELFGPNGAQGGCWCTWFFQTGAEMRANGSAGNKELLRARVRSGVPVGLVAIDDDRPVGWVAVAPRLGYSRLARAKVAAPVDDDLTDVWSVTCFFIHRAARRRGLGALLLEHAVTYAREHGARAVEGYPVDTGGAKKGSGELYHGTLGMFTGAGFELVARRGVNRALVRLTP
ncbi:GNAT family N-acetyltransferase [Saccharothrix sp. S26]|uniref:GNAT family N-acetyltransferase n=1 Tax=Saccharothrix sp. S26 TaxID=2907215 RepID=UPI001F2E360D|nr:GNAT family N-acetyltransferase [Saccharothrix sp. S26]MCE6999381.1 GNAT family N-acetyltransferase [Saccharothrix sp. S26]